MGNLNEIILESIEKFINEGFFEAEDEEKKKHKMRKKHIFKKHNKKSESERKSDGDDWDDEDKETKKHKKRKKHRLKKHSKKSERERKRDGNDLNAEDEAEIRNIVNKSDLINVAALAKKVYPDHTPEGAQSQLRKELKGIKNDSGNEYHIKQRVSNEIRRQLQGL